MRLLPVIPAFAIALATFYGCGGSGSESNTADMTDTLSMADSSQMATDGAQTEQADRDTEFMAKAREANKAEIEAGKMASMKGTSAAVKQFGKMMVDDHTLAQKSLDSLANAMNLQLPDTLNAEHQMLAEQLKQAKGRSFDSLYIASQVKDHQMVMDLMRDIKSNAKSEGLKNYANTYQERIHMHHEKADSIQGILNKK